MDTMDLIRTRRSIRRYKKAPVPDNLVAQILEEACGTSKPAKLALKHKSKLKCAGHTNRHINKKEKIEEVS